MSAAATTTATTTTTTTTTTAIPAYFAAADALYRVDEEMELPADLQQAFEATLLNPVEQGWYRVAHVTRRRVREQFEAKARWRGEVKALLAMPGEQLINYSILHRDDLNFQLLIVNNPPLRERINWVALQQVLSAANKARQSACEHKNVHSGYRQDTPGSDHDPGYFWRCIDCGLQR